MAVYVTSLKKQQQAFLTKGPKNPCVIGGKKAETINCIGIHVGCMYDLQPNEFNWTDQDHLMKITNASGAVSGGIFSNGTKGTLISSALIIDPNFSTAFLPLG